MGSPFYLSLADVLGLHVAVMIATGSRPAHLRDEAALDAAINRPRLAGLYASADLLEQAASLAITISDARAFVDGNKRTAFAAADVFLSENTLLFVGSALDLAWWFETIAEKQGDDRQSAIAHFREWLRQNVTGPQTGP